MRTAQIVLGIILAFVAGVWLTEAALVALTGYELSPLSSVVACLFTGFTIARWAYENITGEAE